MDISNKEKHVFKKYGYADDCINPKPHIDCVCEAGNRCWWKGDNGMYNRFKHKLGWFPKRLDKISRKGKAQVICIQYCGDIADKSVSDRQIEWILSDLVSVNASRYLNKLKLHTFLILTKWPERLWNVIDYHYGHANFGKDGIWIGTSITGEHSRRDWERLASLMNFKGFNLWVSVEPLLDFASSPLKRYLPDINQVIIGAETGANARPCKLEWLRAIRDDCKQAGVSFFLKQVNGKNRVLDERTHDRLEWEDG